MFAERLEYGDDLRIRRRHISGAVCARPLTFVFEHDAQGRLVSATSEADGSSGALRDESLDRRYVYDAHSNVASAVIGRQPHTLEHAPSSNRLDGLDGVRWRFGYDAAERLVTAQETGAFGVPTELVYGEGGAPVAEISPRGMTMMVRGPSGCLAMLRS
jgi:hypothetical protein